MTNTGLGCIPAVRRKVLDQLAAGEATTTEVSLQQAYRPVGAARARGADRSRARVARVQGQGKADRWKLTAAAAGTLETAAGMTSTSAGNTGSGISGTPPRRPPEIPDPIPNGDVDDARDPTDEEREWLDAWRRGELDAEQAP